MPSSVIRSFDYDPSRNELTITFTTGRVYAYSLVPPVIVGELKAAFSKGVFFNEKIRGNYPYRRISRRNRSPG